MTIKKISALLMLSVLPLGVLTAQEDNQKDYLPKAGDLAIGIDMQPVYRFFGNIANGTIGNGLNQFGGEEARPYTGNVTIMGKYMLDNTTALRFNVGVGKVVNNHFDFRPDQKALFENPYSEAKVEDRYKENIATYSVAAGIEFRKGKNRIQGYYGADLVFGMHRERYHMSYGNAITDINQSPARGTWNPVTLDYDAPYNLLGLGAPNVPYWSRAYLTESNENRFEVGIAGKLGVEYFVVPKLSFGGEVSLLVSESFWKGSYTKSEGYNAATRQVETRTDLVNPANRRFNLATTDMGGKLFMMFYF